MLSLGPPPGYKKKSITSRDLLLTSISNITDLHGALNTLEQLQKAI